VLVLVAVGEVLAKQVYMLDTMNFNKLTVVPHHSSTPLTSEFVTEHNPELVPPTPIVKNALSKNPTYYPSNNTPRMISGRSHEAFD